MVDKVLPVDREALAKAIYLSGAWGDPAAASKWDELALPPYVYERERRYADVLIASPVLRALAAAVWDEGWEARDAEPMGGSLSSTDRFNPYREQAR